MTSTLLKGDQLGFSDRDDLVNDIELQDAINAWVAAHERVAEAREDFKDQDGKLQSMVGARRLEAGTYRVGRHILDIADVAAHKRIRIKAQKGQ